jgi:putative transcriptional regulator
MKFKDTIDFVNGILPSKGSVLLSEPFLQDPHFERSVVLMCEHSDAESFGFVLNHPSAVQLNDLVDIAPKSIPVFIGGPVANNSLFYIHTLTDIDSSEEILPGLFFEEIYQPFLNIYPPMNATKKKFVFSLGILVGVKGN